MFWKIFGKIGIFYYIVFMEKKCSKCGEVKSLSEFYKRKNSIDGYFHTCKKCKNEYSRHYHNNNRDSILQRKKDYRKDNIELLKERDRKYYYNNIEELKKCSSIYYFNNKDKILTKRREDYYLNTEKYLTKNQKWRKENKHKLKEYYENNKLHINRNRTKQIKFQREHDKLFKMKDRVRSNIRRSLGNRGWSKKSKTQKFLGCNWETFKEHIESKFTEGMSWDNCSEWHYDHYYPISLAENEEDMYILNYYKNFQPLWIKDNLEKSNKVPDGYEEWYEEISKTRPSF